MEKVIRGLISQIVTYNYRSLYMHLLKSFRFSAVKTLYSHYNFAILSNKGAIL